MVSSQEEVKEGEEGEEEEEASEDKEEGEIPEELDPVKAKRAKAIANARAAKRELVVSYLAS